MINAIKTATAAIAHTMMVLGFGAVCFMGGMAFNTRIETSFTVSGGAQAAEADYGKRIEALSMALPNVAPVPQRKPKVR